MIAVVDFNVARCHLTMEVDCCYYCPVTIEGCPYGAIGTMTRHPLMAANTVMAHSHRTSYSCMDLGASCFLKEPPQSTAGADMPIGLLGDDFGSKS